MIKILLLSFSLCLPARAFAQSMDVFEVTRATFNAGTIVISTSVATLINLTPAQSVKAGGAVWSFYATSLWNITASTAVYTLSASYAAAPELTCDGFPVIGVGSETNPIVLTEQFVGLYMWVKACAPAAITMRRALRGR